MILIRIGGAMVGVWFMLAGINMFGSVPENKTPAHDTLIKIEQFLFKAQWIILLIGVILYALFGI
jgi:hypothetical protein